MDISESTVEYRDIPTFPGYRVGSDGSIWTCRPYARSKDRSPLPWRRLAIAYNHRGYLVAQLWDLAAKKNRHIPIHRLLLECFVGPCPPGMLGLHKNDIHDDNRLENLYWGTQRDNIRDAYDNKRIPLGLDHWKGKLSEQDVREIRQRIAAGEKQEVVANDFQIHRTYVGQIARGKERLYVK